MTIQTDRKIGRRVVSIPCPLFLSLDQKTASAISKVPCVFLRCACFKLSECCVCSFHVSTSSMVDCCMLACNRFGVVVAYQGSHSCSYKSSAYATFAISKLQGRVADSKRALFCRTPASRQDDKFALLCRTPASRQDDKPPWLLASGSRVCDCGRKRNEEHVRPPQDNDSARRTRCRHCTSLSW